MPLIPGQKQHLSNDAVVHLKQLPLLLRKREQRHQQAVELAEAGRERLIPTHLQSQSTSRCQNSSSRMTKGQRDRLICKGKRGGRSQGNSAVVVLTQFKCLVMNEPQSRDYTGIPLSVHCQFVFQQVAICEQTD